MIPHPQPPLHSQMMLLGCGSSGGGDSFSPAHLTNLRFWLDASALTGLADDDPVDSWTDESGVDRHFTSTLNQRPLYKTAIQNGKPVVRFDGADDKLEANGTSSIKSIAIVVKFSAALATAYCGMITGNSAGNDGCFILQDADTYFFGFPADVTFYKDGVAGDETAAGAGPMNAFAVFVMTSATARDYTWMLGDDRNFGTRHWLGDYCEVIGAGDEWDADTVADVTAYLGTKWGVTVS